MRRIAGADTSSKWLDRHGPIHAAIAPLGWPGLTHEPVAGVTVVPRIPYVSGYLGFREAPALVAAWEQLADKPDLLFVDGQGISHPRRCGIAAQLGVLLDVPAIGVAKSLLCGALAHEPGPAAGDRAEVIDRGEVVAMAVRLRPRAAPVFVSIGHRLSLAAAVDWVLRVADNRRLPPPIRAAHDAANALRRSAEVA